MSEENHSRRVARVKYWSDICHALKGPRLERGPHLVVSQNACQDAAMLKVMGIPLRKVVFVGTPESSYEVLERYPEAVALCGDVVEIVREYKRTLVSITVERNTPLDRESLAQLQSMIAHGLPGDAFLGVTFPAETSQVNDLRSWMPKELDPLAEQTYTEHTICKKKEYRWAHLAAWYIEGILSSGLRNQRAYPSLWSVIRSRSDEGDVVATGIYQLFRLPSTRGLDQFYEKLARRVKEEAGIYDTADMTVGEFRRQVLVAHRDPTLKEATPVMYGVTPEMIRIWEVEV